MRYSDGYLAQPKGKNNLDTLMRDVLMKQNHGGFSTTEKGWVGLGRLHISIDTDDISKKNASLTGKEYFGAFTTLLEVRSRQAITSDPPPSNSKANSILEQNNKKNVTLAGKFIGKNELFVEMTMSRYENVEGGMRPALTF